MAKTMQELVGMESPYEAALKATGYKEPPTVEQEKYAKEKAEADIKLAEGKTKVAEERLKSTEELYARPDLQKQKIEAFAPTPESGSDLAKLFALTTAIAFFGGGKGRYSGMAAMGNLASAMEGYKKGRKDLFAQELKEYDKNMKAAIENNKLIEDKLKEYLNLAAKKDEAALTKLAEINALTHRQGALADIEKMTGTNAAKYAETIAKARADWVKHTQEMQQKAADREAAAFEIYTDPKTGQLVRVNKRTGQVSPMAGSEGLIKPTKGGTSAGELRREDRIREMTQGVRAIENLQNQLRDKDVQTGLQAKVKPLLEKIGSLANAEFESAVNNQLTGTDKTTLFLKDALLETYAIERAAKGGQRLTVQDMKTVGPVLDPTNYSPETYNALLDSRRKVLYNNLQDMGLTPEEIKRRSAEKPYEPFAGKELPTVTTQEQYDALQPGEFYLEDGKRYQKPGRK